MRSILASGREQNKPKLLGIRDIRVIRDRRISNTFGQQKCWLDFAARKLSLNEKGSCQLPLQKKGILNIDGRISEETIRDALGALAG